MARNTGRLRIAELQQKVQQEEDADRGRELEITLLEEDQEIDSLLRPQMPVKMSEESARKPLCAAIAESRAHNQQLDRRSAETHEASD
jgi:hypothetical protein